MTDGPGWSAPDRRPGDQPDEDHPDVPPSAGPPPPPPPPPPRGWSTQQPPPSWGTPGQPPGWGQPQPEAPAGWGWGQPRAPEVKPGVIPLRPLGAGEILDGAISAIRAHPRVLLGSAALVAVATTIVQQVIAWLMIEGLSATPAFDPNAAPEEVFDAFAEFIPGFIGLNILSLFISSISWFFLTGLTTQVIGRSVLGQPISFTDAWLSIRPRLVPLLGLSLLFSLILYIGILLCLLPGIFFGVLFALAAPALVLERQPVFAAFGRSRHLVSGSWWRCFGILALAMIIYFVISNVIATPFALLGGGGALFNPTATPDEFGLLFYVLTGIGGILSVTITYPFTAGVAALLYVDQRMRREGLDIELARAAGAGPTGAAGTPAS